LKASISFSGVGAFFLVDHPEAEASGDGRVGPLGCFGEPRGVFRSLGELGDGIRTGASQFAVLVGNDNLVAGFEAGFAPVGGQDGGFEDLIAVATEVEKAQSAAFSSPDMDLQDFGGFCLKVPVGFGW